MIKFSRHRILSRRRLLHLGISSVTALAVLSIAKLKVLSYVIHVFQTSQRVKRFQNRTFTVANRRPLKEKAKAKGIIYGAYADASDRELAANPALQALLAQQSGITVASVLWDRIRPSADKYDFTTPDYFLKFASERKMRIRMHNLVWYNARPAWMKEQLNAKNARQMLDRHIQTVVKRYAGKVHSWDVVNEAIEPKDGRADGLRNYDWLQYLGKDYIEYSFRLTARYDPKALLVYNETDLEYTEANQLHTLKLLERLKSRGTPIHALGIQSHLRGDRDDFNPRKLRAFIRNVADLGLKVMITELDVFDKYLPGDIAQRDRVIAATYEDYLNTVLAEKSVSVVINWGLSDLHTWHSFAMPREDGQPSRPLPYDRNLKPKLAWNAIARAIDRAPKR